MKERPDQPLHEEASSENAELLWKLCLNIRRAPRPMITAAITFSGSWSCNFRTHMAVKCFFKATRSLGVIFKR